MARDDNEDARIRKVAHALKAAIRANETGHRGDVIYQLKVAEWLCLPDELMAPPPPPQSLGTLLDITRVSALTGYSRSRLRHMGHKLAGYWKSPTGKVGWWSGPLEAALGLPHAPP
jgi:hypothetical protein